MSRTESEFNLKKFFNLKFFQFFKHFSTRFLKNSFLKFAAPKDMPL